jgi:hypothetical protein
MFREEENSAYEHDISVSTEEESECSWHGMLVKPVAKRDINFGCLKRSRICMFRQ